jgi:hypothetical protein
MDDAIAEAQKLTQDIRESMGKPRAERVAEAILQQPRSLKVIERLLDRLQGYRSGVIADQVMISNVAMNLLVEIAKLRDARRVRGRATLADDFIDGTAPRLWELARKLEECLK